MSDGVSPRGPERYDVFLSYSKKDTHRAKMLAGALEDAGVAVWWDRQIPPAMTWAQVIEAAIHASRTVVVVWTSASVESEWVKKEARKGEQMGGLVPILAEECQIPFEFEHVQAANLIGWDGHTLTEGFNTVLESIERLADVTADREYFRQAWRRTLGKRRLTVTAILSVWITAAAFLFFVPLRSTSLDLVGMKLTGLLVNFDTIDVAAMGDVPVDFLAVSGDAPLDTVLIAPESLDRVTSLFGVSELVFLPDEDGGPSTLRLTGFRYEPGGMLELQRPVDDFSLRSPPTREWRLAVTGDWTVIAGEMDELFAFGSAGSVTIRSDQALFFDFQPAESAETVELFSNVRVRDVEFSYYDPLDTVGAQPTVRGGTFDSRWATGIPPLHESSALGFDSYGGEIGRLWIAGDTLRANLHGEEVAGIRLDGESIMPSRFATLGAAAQGSLLFILSVTFVGLGGLAWQWRRRW